MTSSQVLSSIFPDNAITRAELIYQRRSARPFTPFRQKINRFVRWLMIIIAILQFGGLLIASLAQWNPIPLIESLQPLPTLVILPVVLYHFYLIFQTLSISAYSIAREKEAQTWDLLVLTGINARQLVRGKWWATVQRQLPFYLFLGVIRAGATAAIAVSFGAVNYSASGYYDRQITLPSTTTIFMSCLLGVVFTLANLGLSSACGVMASAASKRSTTAVLRGIANQIILSLIIAIPVGLEFSLLYRVTSGFLRELLHPLFMQSTYSLVDNGYILLVSPMAVTYYLSNQNGYPHIAPVQIGWVFGACFALSFYVLLIWFALWRAENSAVRSSVTPSS